ncbi:MAG TPA: plastocyanin/azurin family copper-binding protein [bacterium]|nr:plastocyanin/azurin family copper-binding protein [bacterium]
MVVLLAVLLSTSLVWAGGDLSRQTPVELKVLLGAKSNEFTISPKTWTLETGKLYKITLVNEGKVKHEWVASEFTLNIWTRKVEVGGVEVKGVINEIELQPGAKADWFFVPIRTGEFEMACEIEGHKEAGMVGKIVVK